MWALSLLPSTFACLLAGHSSAFCSSSSTPLRFLAATVLGKGRLSTTGEALPPVLGAAVPGSPPAWRGAFTKILPFGSAPLPVRIKKGEAATVSESSTTFSLQNGPQYWEISSRVFTAMDLRILAELWGPTSNWDSKGNCSPQGLRPRATHNDNSPRKGQTESLTRKTGHQTQMPAVCLYLS